MLHKGADHTTIAMHDQPAREPLPSSVNRVTDRTGAWLLIWINAPASGCENISSAPSDPDIRERDDKVVKIRIVAGEAVER